MEKLQAGLSSTFPNFMTAERVRGMEFAAWSDGNLPTHTVAILFTRILAGAINYNAGIIDIKFNSLNDKKFNWIKPKKKYPKNSGPCIKTTIVKQLAMHDVLFSPKQMSQDWEDTKVLNGEIGEYHTIARKGKNSDNGFLGSITHLAPRNFGVSLSILDPDKKYVAHIYTDVKNAHWDNNPTDFELVDQEVTSESILKIDLAPGDGQTISLFPNYY